MIPEQNRFESDPEDVLTDDRSLPGGWSYDAPDPGAAGDVDELTALLRAHEEGGRGWASSDRDDVLVEIGEVGRKMRENIVFRNSSGRIRAWGSVHDRAAGRMLYLHIVARDLEERVARRCSDILIEWARGQARAVGEGRGLSVQQIDCGAFEGDARQAEWLTASGFRMVRTWWQMDRAVTAEEQQLVRDPDEWERKGVRFRLVDREGGVLPDEEDLRNVHDVLEGAFVDHFNSFEENFAEFLHRLREDPGHRWNQWWLAELMDETTPGGRALPVGALIGTLSVAKDGPDSSYVSYIGVLEAARGRGVAKGLLNTIVCDAARRGRRGVGLEVDADSSTGAHRLYTAMGWETAYVTQSWHHDVPVT